MNVEDYIRAFGSSGYAIWDVLAAGCEVPPSIEVFMAGLRELRKATGQTMYPLDYAKRLARTYHRVPLT